MQEIVRVAVGFIIVGGLFWLFESLWPENRQQRKWHEESGTNLLYFIFDATISRLIVGIFVLLAIGLLFLFAPRTGPTWVSQQNGWLQGLEMLLISGFFNYWAHRIGHTSRVLWRFHSIHHSTQKLDWLAAGRLHPLDSIVITLASLVPLYLLGFSREGLALYAPFLALYPIFLHANVSWDYGPFRYIIGSPAYHRWHHAADAAAINKNYSGLFPFYDIIFGTYYFPRHAKPTRYGLHSTTVPTGIWQQLKYPFQRPKVAERETARGL